MYLLHRTAESYVQGNWRLKQLQSNRNLLPYTWIRKGVEILEHWRQSLGRYTWDIYVLTYSLALMLSDSLALLNYGRPFFPIACLLSPSLYLHFPRRFFSTFPNISISIFFFYLQSVYSQVLSELSFTDPFSLHIKSISIFSFQYPLLCLNLYIAPSITD
jgi:hypothetical protein